jgi:predicted ester cyclase
MKTVQAKILLPFVCIIMPSMIMAQAVNQKRKNKQIIMTTTHHKDIVCQLYEQALNNRNFNMLHTMISDDCTGPRGNRGVAVFEEPVIALINAFPDIHWKIEELLAQGDKVAVSWKWTGNHQMPFQRFAATGKAVTNTGIGIYTFKAGKIVNVNIQTDRLGFLQEIGAIPTDISQLPVRQQNANHVIFIDKFVIPQKAKDEFMSRTNYNRAFIKKLPGFINDNAYQSTDKDGNLLITTVATWENEAALNKAKQIVQTEYKRIGFDPAEMTKRLGITLSRDIYKPLDQ